MTAARESAGQMFAKRESRDGDHADVLRKLEITIERPTGAIAQVAEESQALAAQRVVETIHQRGWISREQPLGHRRAVQNPAEIDPCCYVLNAPAASGSASAIFTSAPPLLNEARMTGWSVCSRSQSQMIRAFCFNVPRLAMGMIPVGQLSRSACSRRRRPSAPERGFSR